MKRLSQSTFGFLTMCIAVFGLGVSAASGATRYVATTGMDVGNCTNSSMPCMTIQYAVSQANNGDTISVAAGTYPESQPGPLTINKSVTLEGEQAGVDARTARGAESIITDPQGTSVAADGVVIDGFTVQDSVVSAFTGFGIWINPGRGGTQIVNNIIQNNIIGIGLANLGAQAVIEHNLIRNNNMSGPASGTGIYTDEFSGGPFVRDVLIKENAFLSNDDAGIDSSNTDFLTDGGGVFNLDIDSNLFNANGRAVVLFNTHMSAFHGNSVTNNTLLLSAAIRIFDNNTDLAIFNNDIRNGVGHGIRLNPLFGVNFPNSGVVINENNIGVVGSLNFALTGLTVEPGSHVGPVNAECNWWGSSTGPSAISNPMGMGEEAVGNADFSPWLLGPIPNGPCLGGVLSTAGKTTGGGQIGSDPVFSSLGELLSVPALVPSLADPSAQATFGFVAKCCAASGNLEYNDHAASVRIKAQTVDGLVISSPAVSCPAVPGSMHATFTGMAAVIRPAATTNERYTVDVDDCGEPGSADTFGIKTTTYSNGPSPLIGGNIQIHK